jgi:hypothetical protein
MVFKRVLHDGLNTVIHRQGKAKIVFVNGVFEADDKEQIEYLQGEGYTVASVEEKTVASSFDYAVRKMTEDGFTGRAKVVKDTKEQAENYMLEKELDLDVYGIEERERK